MQVIVNNARNSVQMEKGMVRYRNRTMPSSMDCNRAELQPVIEPLIL